MVFCGRYGIYFLGLLWRLTFGRYWGNGGGFSFDDVFGGCVVGSYKCFSFGVGREGEKLELLLFIDDVIIYLEKVIDLLDKLLELISLENLLDIKINSMILNFKRFFRKCKLFIIDS